MEEGFSAELTERRPGTGDFRGLLSRSLGPMIYVRINTAVSFLRPTAGEMRVTRWVADALRCDALV